MVHFSDILMVLKDPRFDRCERIYAIDFPLFLKRPSKYPNNWAVPSGFDKLTFPSITFE